MSIHSLMFVVSVSCILLMAVDLHAQPPEAETIKITNPKLSSINMGLDSSKYWLDKMKAGDQQRGAALLADLEKLATRFNRIPKSDDAQYQYIVNRFAALATAIQEKSGQSAGQSKQPPTKEVSNDNHGKPHRNLFTVNRQLDGIEEALKTFNGTSQNAIKRLKAQLGNANQMLQAIPESEHPEYLAAKNRFDSLAQQASKFIPQWNSTEDPAEYLAEMRKKYLKTLALPRAQRLMANRELTDQDVQTFLGGIAAFKTGLEQDLPQIKAAATTTGTASDLVAWVDREANTFIQEESEKLQAKLDRLIETTLKDAEHLAGLDPEKNKFTFVTESVRNNNEDKFARAFRTMENAVSIEEAMNLPGRWSSKKSELEKYIAAYRKKAAQATTVEHLPNDIKDQELAKIAAQTLAAKKYGVGEIERLIVNSKKVPRDRIQTRYFNRALETIVREWEEFQVCTVEKEGDKYIVYFNTLKKFSRGPDTTPIGEWILSVRFKSGEISQAKLK